MYITSKLSSFEKFKVLVFLSTIDRVGEVYCWGSNQHGQCGMDPCSQHNKICWSPTRIKGLLENENVLEIFSGWSHILAKTGIVIEATFFVVYIEVNDSVFIV